MTPNRRRPMLFFSLAAMALAIAAVPAASASAHNFQVSATGEFAGTQTSNQVFTPGPGASPIICHQASSAGTLISTTYEVLPFTYAFSGCTIPSLFNAGVEASPANIVIWANGKVALENTVTLGAPSLGCSVTIPPQEWSGAVGYTNVLVKSTKEVEASITLTGVTGHGTGLCGPSTFTEGTFTGSSLIHRVGGGNIWWV